MTNLSHTLLTVTSTPGARIVVLDGHEFPAYVLDAEASPSCSTVRSASPVSSAKRSGADTAQRSRINKTSLGCSGLVWGVL